MAVKTPKAPAKNVRPAKPAAVVEPIKTSPPAPITWDDATDFMSAGSDAGRLNTLHYLETNGETSVGALVATTKTTQPAMSHALGLLRMQRMVRARRDGKNVFYSITDTGKRLLAFALSIVND